MQSPSCEQLNREMDSSQWPMFNLIVSDAQSLQFNISIDAKLSFFQGHFPGQAVLPGVVQVHWAGELGRRFFGCRGFTSLKKVKFNSVILPATTLELSLAFWPQTGRLNFSYRHDDQDFSSGVISFQGTP